MTVTKPVNLAILFILNAPFSDGQQTLASRV
jgi:hypothetical protein